MLGYAGEDKEQAEVKSLNSTFSASVYIFKYLIISFAKVPKVNSKSAMLLPSKLSLI